MLRATVPRFAAPEKGDPLVCAMRRPASPIVCSSSEHPRGISLAWPPRPRLDHARRLERIAIVLRRPRGEAEAVVLVGPRRVELPERRLRRLADHEQAVILAPVVIDVGLRADGEAAQDVLLDLRDD